MASEGTVLWVVFVVFFILAVIVTVVLVVCAPCCNEQKKKRVQGTTLGVYSSQVGTSGRFGNQCFQVAALIATGKKYNRDVHVYWPQGNKLFAPKDTLPFDKAFLVPERVQTVCEKVEFRCEEIDVRHDMAIELFGYRQHPQYFAEAHDEIRDLFTVREDILARVKNELSCLETQNCIGVHVRRGDYLKTKNKMFQVCHKTYYLFGIQVMRERFPNGPVILVTDDKRWCQKELEDKENGVFVSPFKTQEDDFACLTLCKATVISNSTFSWFASFLAQSDVVAPWPWMKVATGHAPTTAWEGLYLPHWTVYNTLTNTVR